MHFNKGTPARKAGSRQEFMGAVDYTKSGCPDIDARTSRFKSLSHLLGPLGRRVFVHQLQRPSAYSEAPLLGVGRGIGSPCVVLAAVCRDPARLHRSLSSSIEPYVRSPLPTPEEP